MDNWQVEVAWSSTGCKLYDANTGQASFKFACRLTQLYHGIFKIEISECPIQIINESM